MDLEESTSLQNLDSLLEESSSSLLHWNITFYLTTKTILTVINTHTHIWIRHSRFLKESFYQFTKKINSFFKVVTNSLVFWVSCFFHLKSRILDHAEQWYESDMNLFGFERVIVARQVGYKAPNGVTLGSVGEVKRYLIDKGSSRCFFVEINEGIETCKCGLGKRITLSAFDFTPPPPIKLTLHRHNHGTANTTTQWSTTQPKKRKKRAPTPPIPVKTKFGNKKRNLESIMAKLEHRRLSSEDQHNENNSNSKQVFYFSFGKREWVCFNTVFSRVVVPAVESNNMDNIDTFEIIDSFSSAEPKVRLHLSHRHARRCYFVVWLKTYLIFGTHPPDKVATVAWFKNGSDFICMIIWMWLLQQVTIGLICTFSGNLLQFTDQFVNGHHTVIMRHLIVWFDHYKHE